MYLKSVSGQVLFEGRFHTVRKAVEAAIEGDVCLDFVDLRHANLRGALLDGASLKSACLWGADLEGAALTGVNLQGSDCRNANFKDCCLAESDCHESDFRGSYFSRTILTSANLSDAKFSCPSLFSLNLSEVSSLARAIYSHKGEIDCDLSHPPIIIHGLPKRIVLMEGQTLIGHTLYPFGVHDQVFPSLQTLISKEKTLQSKGRQEGVLQNAKFAGRKTVR